MVPVCTQILEKRGRSWGLIDDASHDMAFQDEDMFSLEGNPTPKGDHDWMLDRAQEMFAKMGDDFERFFSHL